MVRNADSIENAIGPQRPGGRYAYGFGGAVEPQRSPRTQSVSCGRRGSGSTDTPIRQYVWGAYIDECVQLNLLVAAGPQSVPAGAYYLLQNLLYRAVALVNSSGQVVEAYDTDAYGNTLIFTAPGADGIWFTDDDVQSDYGANEIIYCGYRFDSETELYFVRNRTYNAVLGRWIQRDPIGYQGGINLYEYVGGMVGFMADPMGLWWTYWNNPLTNLIGAGLYNGYTAGAAIASQAGQDAKSALHKLENIPRDAMREIAKALFHEFCHCKQIEEGAFYGVNLSASGSGFAGGGLAVAVLALSGFRGNGGSFEGGIQALVECGAKSVAFYGYGGLAVGFGTKGLAGLVNLGGLGGYGVGAPIDYRGWFTATNFGGAVGRGWAIGANGGNFHGTSPSGGPVDGGYINIAGGASTGPGLSFTRGAQYYWLLGVVPAQ